MSKTLKLYSPAPHWSDDRDEQVESRAEAECVNGSAIREGRLLDPAELRVAWEDAEIDHEREVAAWEDRVRAGCVALARRVSAGA